jgi:hypothetical protein
MNLMKMMRFRLNFCKSPKYIKWLKQKDKDKDFHHVVSRKTTDYLGILITREEHQKRHSNMAKYFEEDLLVAIKNLIEYVTILENKTKEL